MTVHKTALRHAGRGAHVIARHVDRVAAIVALLPFAERWVCMVALSMLLGVTLLEMAHRV